MTLRGPSWVFLALALLPSAATRAEKPHREADALGQQAGRVRAGHGP